jgi:nucleoredoxin
MKTTFPIFVLVLFSFTQAFGEMRTWTSSVGSTLKAELEECVGNKVVLRSANGRLITLSIKQLSQPDQKMVIEWKKQKIKSPVTARTYNSTEAPKPKLGQGLAQMLPANLLDSMGKKVSQDKLAGKTVGFYFSAHWCPPCRQFTPRLVKFRDANKEEFEVVFVSSDHSPKEQMKYMKETNMKWYTLPHRSKDANALARKLNVRGIPTLVIVNPDGETVTTKGTSNVINNAKRALHYWKKPKVP